MSIEELKDHRPRIMDFQRLIPGVKITSSKSLLWPFQAFKVSLPSYRERELNIFEETVLRFSLINICTVKQLAEETCLAEEIIEFIQSRLNNFGLLTRRNEPTERAMKFMEMWKDKPTEYTAGTVFVDMITGRIMPIVINGQLQYEPLQEVKKDSVIFTPGSTGKARAVKALRIVPNREYFSVKPVPVDVIKAARDHSSLHRRYSSLNDTAIELPRYSNLVDAITVADSGELVFLHCKVIIQKGSEDFIVSDPFGYGISSAMTSNFRQLIKINKGAYSLIDSLKENAQKVAINKEEDKPQEDNREFSEFGIYPEIKRRLIISKRSFNKLKQVVESSADEKARQKAINDMADSFYSCYEWALRQVIFDYPAEEWVRIFSTLSYMENESILRDLTEKCGFKIPKKTSLLQVKPGKIKAFKTSQVEMQPLLALAIAGASQNPLHPLNNLALRDPLWLEYMNELKKQRDSVFHGENAAIESMGEKWSKFIASMQYLFPQVKFSKESSLGNVEFDDEYSQERMNSRFKLDKYFGIDKVIEMPERLREQLMNIQMFMDAQEGTIQEKLDCMKAVLDFANVLQGSLFRVFRSGKMEKVPMEELKESARKRALEAGFNLPNNVFPISIATVNNKRLELTCQGKDVTLGANLLGVLILAEDTVLQKLAGDLPDLINFIASIAKLRSHGNYSIFLDWDELCKLKDEVYHIVKYFTEAQYEE